MELEVTICDLKFARSSSVSWKTKVRWKTIDVSPHGLIEKFSRDALDTREIVIEHHALAADRKDRDLGERAIRDGGHGGGGITRPSDA